MRDIADFTNLFVVHTLTLLESVFQDTIYRLLIYELITRLKYVCEKYAGKFRMIEYFTLGQIPMTLLVMLHIL